MRWIHVIVIALFLLALLGWNRHDNPGPQWEYGEFSRRIHLTAFHATSEILWYSTSSKTSEFRTSDNANFNTQEPGQSDGEVFWKKLTGKEWDIKVQKLPPLDMDILEYLGHQGWEVFQTERDPLMAVSTKRGGDGKSTWDYKEAEHDGLIYHLRRLTP